MDVQGGIHSGPAIANGSGGVSEQSAKVSPKTKIKVKLPPAPHSKHVKAPNTPRNRTQQQRRDKAALRGQNKASYYNRNIHDPRTYVSIAPKQTTEHFNNFVHRQVALDQAPRTPIYQPCPQHFTADQNLLHGHFRTNPSSCNPTPEPNYYRRSASHTGAMAPEFPYHHHHYPGHQSRPMPNTPHQQQPRAGHGGAAHAAAAGMPCTVPTQPKQVPYMMAQAPPSVRTVDVLHGYIQGFGYELDKLLHTITTLSPSVAARAAAHGHTTTTASATSTTPAPGASATTGEYSGHGAAGFTNPDFDTLKENIMNRLMLEIVPALGQLVARVSHGVGKGMWVNRGSVRVGATGGPAVAGYRYQNLHVVHGAGVAQQPQSHTPEQQQQQQRQHFGPMLGDHAAGGARGPQHPQHGQTPQTTTPVDGHQQEDDTDHGASFR